MNSVHPARTDADAAIAILGIPFDRVNLAGAIERIEAMVHSRQPHYVVTANVDFLVQARSDIELRHILLNADLVLCDGTPLVWASRLLGNPLPERVAGADLTPRLLAVAAERGYRVFLLGATPESAAAAVDRVSRKHPALVVDFYSPPFGRLLEMDHEEIRKRVLAARPDILLISFGCPKQEKWIAMHYRDLGVPVSIGVGATIDFLAEHVRRAPAWMQRSGTEWIYRLMQEPRRLAGRYSRDLWGFGSAFLKQVATLRPDRRAQREAVTEPVRPDFPCSIVQLPAKFDRESIASWDFNSAGLNGENCILDGRMVSRVDSTALALLIRWYCASRTRGGALLLLSPTFTLRRSLSYCGHEDFFLIASDLQEAARMIQNTVEGRTQAVTSVKSARKLDLQWAGEVTAATSKEIWKRTTACLEQSDTQQAPRQWALDLQNVSFMDSTGLGLLIRLRKLAEGQGCNLSIRSPSPAVMNVIRLANLEAHLLGSTGQGRRAWTRLGRSPDEVRSSGAPIAQHPGTP